jgi:hypothetical protein
MKVLLSTAATNCALSCALSAEKSGRYFVQEYQNEFVQTTASHSALTSA